MNIKHTVKQLVVTALIVIPFMAMAGVDTETDENDVILAGHDVVAYFTESKPVMGKTMFTAAYNDAIYHFSSAVNRDMFKKAPDRYAPQYGGFCAYGVTLGQKFEVDGKAFEIVDGKLYVNKNLKVYGIWKKEVPSNIKSANIKWNGIHATEAAKL